MRISKLLLTCMCWVLSVAAVWGQAANSQAATGQGKPGILGHFDPQTRVFRPLPQPADGAAEPSALTTVTGTITITFTITIKSSGIKNPVCLAIVDVADDIGPNERTYTELGVLAAKGSGSTWTCVVSVPYSWDLATHSADMMKTSYEITNIPFPLATATPPDRTTILIPLDQRTVPANGTTTTLTASVTL